MADNETAGCEDFIGLREIDILEGEEFVDASPEEDLGVGRVG